MKRSPPKKMLSNIQNKKPLKDLLVAILQIQDIKKIMASQCKIGSSLEAECCGLSAFADFVKNMIYIDETTLDVDTTACQMLVKFSTI